MQPGLELGREHEVHEDEREREGAHERHEDPAHLSRLPVGEGGVPDGQVLAHEDLLHRVGDGPVTEARRGIRHERHLPLSIEAIDARWPRAVTELHDIGQGDETEPLGGDGEEPQAFFVGAVAALRAHVHFVLLAVFLVIGDLVALDEEPQ